jgi:hypothetical protein
MLSFDLPPRTEWQIVWPRVESRMDPLPCLRNLPVQLKRCAMPCAWQGSVAVTLSHGYGNKPDPAPFSLNLFAYCKDKPWLISYENPLAETVRAKFR